MRGFRDVFGGHFVVLDELLRRARLPEHVMHADEFDRYGTFLCEQLRDRASEPAGDLVFFGYHGDAGQIHHVGIYCGSYDFIEAPYTGASVRISSLTGRIESRGDYVGACRP